ncbi:MAG: conjugal transfer protein TraG [Sphingobacteriales bacterium 50-39]|nr:TraG family conjugative transposon ATPase [Sphingobacteriales bacterium]OJW52853.1 MAG: conjugal transfer protein TraG [Sphingobacteriales bacterium 50-39]
MEKQLNDILPIMSVENDCIISKQGDYTVAFEVTKPEIFTLASSDFEALHQNFVKAIKVLPVGSVFHMQDWFIQDTYEANFEHAGDSFLFRASERYFNERPYLNHTSYIFLTKRPAGRKTATSATSSLLRKSIVPQETLHPQKIQEFLESAGQFAHILEDGGFIKLRRLATAEIISDSHRAGIIERYCFLCGNPSKPIVRDLAFDKGIQVGELQCQLYTLADVQDLPGLVGPRVNYERYSTDKTKFSVGFATGLGQLLHCNHIYDQYVFIEDVPATMKKLEGKRLRLQSLANYSRENTIARDATNDFLNEAIAEQRMPVRAHFNILAWSDNPEEARELRNKVSSALAQLEAQARLETVGAPQIFWAGVPGNAGDFPQNDTFDTFLEQAACLFNTETNYRDSVSPFGIRLVDRLNGHPVHVDISDEPMQKGIISNRNKAVFGGSGSGKSVFMNHLMRSYYEQGAHVVIVDVGGSYNTLCNLVNGYYFTYKEKDPIRFNPFFVGKGDVLDTEKKESIKTLLLALWKKDDEQFRRSEYVALSNALTQYFDFLREHPDIFPGFDSFYEFLQDVYIGSLKADKVKEKDFDVDNFLYVLRPYYRGGEFDYLLNATENLDVLQQRFIVFELDNVKDHPILFPVVTLIIMELFISKMRKLKGIRKVITIEEAWKAIAKAGMAEFLKYLYKTVRKFFGEAIVVTQEVDDIISSPIIKDAILNNADCRILLDMRKFQNKFEPLQATLGLTDKGKMMVLSLNRANDPKRKYRELFIDLAGMSMKVYGYEPSLFEYYAYTTEEKEKVKVMEYAAKYGSIRKGIEALVAELEQRA